MTFNRGKSRSTRNVRKVTTNVLRIDDYELRDALAIIVAFGSERFGYLVSPNVAMSRAPGFNFLAGGLIFGLERELSLAMPVVCGRRTCDCMKDRHL